MSKLSEPAFVHEPDLASRALGGSVVFANDEFFAERENLIKPAPAVFSPDAFGHKGKVYDGWETRRRREPGHDHAIVRLGVPGTIGGIVVDTAWFTGNYPPGVSIEATAVQGYPSPAELAEAVWTTLVPRSPVAGDTQNPFVVADDRIYTHVRLSIHPDGGVARLRVHGRAAADPRLLAGTVDLAGATQGGRVLACSNRHYSSPEQILLPDRARIMGDGWENARRRQEGNDHVLVALGARGRVRRIEVDTSYFVGNAPGWAAVVGADTSDREVGEARWRELVPRTRLQPDTRHFFTMDPTEPITHVRLDVYPDGGIARFRVEGEIDEADLAAYGADWRARLGG
jgi:allantoicase